ncbi:hypothetical protein [Saccharibacillus alkalitolerans]|uniref:Uncharacterized protein n=1 Tax=Saccharibacillus alkalitolerans TaxID=2705290 RepID=A0ABX0F6N5_9BACL|nr:hypothetical protein [Saccharibacillus alkalitolerans]NGZ75669.1 hypothetical protein [Saccharibacillus alkalitolerans]
MDRQRFYNEDWEGAGPRGLTRLYTGYAFCRIMQRLLPESTLWAERAKKLRTAIVDSKKIRVNDKIARS